ncbi:hypothetical protein CLAFUW4_11472 [Fulvia fulva]|nr:hypothetical protein CLAFUR4_11478 [Fulvia fulva]KAK4620686.1 hypothetical protein CLAFUR0_11486 [Fulvia fulva]WPV17713.1 hypothetical protein CLAFUW4_11472 [Fulvia fulva]WPV31979.1 hypothetical protein CLAFUW7_11477 [Fulvia fulva]
MAPTQLHLFPAPSTSMPRKTSLKRLKTDHTPNAKGELNVKGVAFQVVRSPKSVQVDPAADTIKHSLFCDPAVATATIARPVISSTAQIDTPKGGPIRRQSRTRRRSSPITSAGGHESHINPTSSVEDDELCPLPMNTDFGSSSPPKRSLPPLRRPNIPQNISTTPRVRQLHDATSPIDERDQLSPLPSKTRFKTSSPAPSTEFPATVRSASPATSLSQKRSAAHGYTSPMRSMFPIYDPARSLDRQSYYPSPVAQSPPPYLRDNVSKVSSPVERQGLRRYDSGVGLVDGYEHIPAAAHADLEALWKASREEYPVAGRKCSFSLYQPSGHGKTLAIGTSPEDLLYSMERDHHDSPAVSSTSSKRFAIQKHCPTAPSSSPVAQLVLPERMDKKSSSKEAKEITAIFPQAAAVSYIEAVLNSPQAHHIATFDPNAESPQAERLASDAVADAHRDYSCDLIKKSRKRDSLGSVTAAYDLVHPTLGTCPVTVTRSQSLASSTGPRAKISLHHPSATPAAIASGTLNLAFLDFAHDACVLDIPGLLALDSHHVLDTVIATLLAVAIIENDALVQESITFEAPPRTPLTKSTKPERRSSVGSSTSRKLFSRNGTRKDKKQKKAEPEPAVIEEQVELPGVARASLKVIEFGFKATAWVVITGVKVGFKVGTGVVGYGAKKLAK